MLVPSTFSTWVGRIAVASLLACGSGPGKPQGTSEAAATSEAPIFSEDTTLKFEIRGPLGALNGPTINEGDLLPGEIVIGGKRVPIQIGARGRTSFRECTFRKLEAEIPPTAVAAAAAAGTPFAGIASFKLATHCDVRDGMSLFGRLGDERAVFRERLAYRYYQAISPQLSLRTRRARITYVSTDASGAAANITKDAFVLEDFKTFKKRLTAEKVEPNAIERTKLDQTALATSYLFELLIDNSDWQIADIVRNAFRSPPPPGTVSIDNEEGAFNFKVFRRPTGGDIPLPYDFDIARTVVGAPRDAVVDNAAFLRGEPKRVRDQAFFLAGFWRMFPDHASRKAATKAVLKARPAIEKATETAELDAAGKRIALERVNTFYDTLVRVVPEMTVLDRGPLTLFERKDAEKSFCTRVAGAEPIVVVEETPTRIGFQLPVDTLDGTQCEGLAPEEFAPATRTFWVDRARVVKLAM